MTTDEVIQQKSKQFVEQITEHADSVRLFVTFHEAGVTKSFVIGDGNFYAQLGLVSEWLVRQKEIVREDVKNNE